MHDKHVLGTLLGASHLKTHRDLFHWLQRDVRQLLPHDILLAAWGDFSGPRISLDVVSALPGMRTTEPLCRALQPFLANVFDAWVAVGRMPFARPFDAGIPAAILAGEGSVLPEMRAVVAHGITDERGGMDCLYMALSRDCPAGAGSVEAMGMLLPCIDAAFRQVALLPMQREGRPGMAVRAELVEGELADSEGGGAKNDEPLSRREQEIMRWVSVGKTNIEIARILEISPRTVRNHLQNVFRKLDVMNRAQAVFELEQWREGR